MDEFIDRLPQSLQTIVRLTDLSTALTLVNKYGGQEFHVPTLKMVNDRHELAALIGFSNLKQLCQYYNGDTIYIPFAKDYAQFLRNEKIKQDSKTLNNFQLAKKYNLSTRGIRKIKRKLKEPEDTKKKVDERQIDLFGF